MCCAAAVLPCGAATASFSISTHVLPLLIPCSRAHAFRPCFRPCAPGEHPILGAIGRAPLSRPWPASLCPAFIPPVGHDELLEHELERHHEAAEADESDTDKHVGLRRVEERGHRHDAHRCRVHHHTKPLDDDQSVGQPISRASKGQRRKTNDDRGEGSDVLRSQPLCAACGVARHLEKD